MLLVSSVKVHSLSRVQAYCRIGWTFLQYTVVYALCSLWFSIKTAIVENILLFFLPTVIHWIIGFKVSFLFSLVFFSLIFARIERFLLWFLLNFNQVQSILLFWWIGVPKGIERKNILYRQTLLFSSKTLQQSDITHQLDSILLFHMSLFDFLAAH